MKSSIERYEERLKQEKDEF